MSISDIERLRSIKTFPSLVKYLRDELEWPIESEDFDELTFEYEPEELGLDSKTAVKVKEIKQLRPLVTNQPWGIFFVNFEPKRLPVVVLRRILRSLVLRKRQSANKSQQATWNLHDLLFISSYGETEHRDITFAHFAEEDGTTDLPTLRVLGWDDEDTVLHLDHADKILREKLRWPEDSKSIEQWRSSWSSAFTLRVREVIGTAEAMAERLAELATAIRKRVNKVLAIESESGALRKLMTAFREALIHDLKEDDFADMYAQTITYGLLSERISPRAKLFSKSADEEITITNPFLRDMLSTFLTVGGRKGKIDFDELGINEVVQALRDADMEAVLRDFGDKNPQEDPVIHFYEDFLKEYDAEKRTKRGVFYTPRPVVSFIVRSVDEILRKEFGLEDGLADTTTWGEMAERHKDLKIPKGVSPKDPFVQILDPACGTGTFLVEAIDVIHRTMKAKWRKQGHMELELPNLWNDYVSEHLLPRLYGFELMMAPYAIAHMKLGLKLHETGYNFRSHERARIYLTNTLEEPKDFSDRFEFDAPALAHEAHAVNAVKRQRCFTVVIGNPPYSNFGQLNRIPFILELLEDYKRGLNERKLNLDDDFIKFVRFSQYVLDKSGGGVLGMITNDVFVDGITHRRMRESLMASFSILCILDLHGSAKKFEQSPDGSKDENVFDIQQGVGISIFLKPRSPGPSKVMRGDLWGSREKKYQVLARSGVETTSWSDLCPSPPNFFFAVERCGSERKEYEVGWSTKAIFPVNNDGMQTKRDSLAIQFTEADVAIAVRDLKRLSDKDLRAKYDLPEDGRDWAVKWARKDVEKHEGFVAPVAYRPFDKRQTFYTGRSKGFIAYPRAIISTHLVGGTCIGLALNRFIKLDYIAHFFAVKSLVDTHLLETANSCLNVCPLYILAGDVNKLSFGQGKRPNLSQDFLQALAAKLGLKPLGPYALPEGLTPEDIFQYAYAVFHSPGYRRRYAESLKIDFPRLPLTGNLELFCALARPGGDLVALHLLEDNYPFASWNTSKPKGKSPFQNLITKFAGNGDDEVAKGYPKYAAGKVFISPTRWFEGVPDDVWNFHIGGYKVCEKWLKDRRGRTLSDEDIAHYQRVVVALQETIRLMAEIDKVIDAHGGWPSAFAPGTRS